jgi:endonuclease YncB( thermonuclease family)
MVDAIVEVWTQLGNALGLGVWEFSIAALTGGATYGCLYGGTQWILRRLNDPVAGSSLLGVLGLRGEEERTMRGTVTKVFDGDTIEVGGERVVRFIGIDAPEKSRSEKLRRDARETGMSPLRIVEQGEEAKAWLDRLIGGETVELEMDPDVDRTDKYDRTLAHVWTIDEHGEKGFLVSRMIVSHGHALPTSDDHRYASQMEKAWEMAQREGLAENLGVPRFGRKTRGLSPEHEVNEDQEGDHKRKGGKGEIGNPHYWRP